ncbi:MAG: DUF4956 domain-containing protein [Oscillospiraceae bacterium]|jgi:uncharacterized membrane protein YhiD involved in acid resistance|nr:DUF4956 domain-containing protein [Oscillospiraceae bacterium]
MPLIQTLAISDLIKKKALEQLTSISVGSMALALVTSFLIGLLILVIYRITFRGVIFSKSFAFSLVLLGMITAMVIATISSNLALSLGMVGALSIVRFRTAVKDPVDTIFMFWSIGVGIMCGAGIYMIAAVATVVMGVLYYVLGLVVKRRSEPFLLVIRYETEYEKNVTWLLQKLAKYRIKSKTMDGTQSELALEITLNERTNATISKAQAMEGIHTISLVSYESEFGLG